MDMASLRLRPGQHQIPVRVERREVFGLQNGLVLARQPITARALILVQRVPEDRKPRPGRGEPGHYLAQVVGLLLLGAHEACLIRPRSIEPNLCDPDRLCGVVRIQVHLPFERVEPAQHAVRIVAVGMKGHGVETPVCLRGDEDVHIPLYRPL